MKLAILRSIHSVLQFLPTCPSVLHPNPIHLVMLMLCIAIIVRVDLIKWVSRKLRCSWISQFYLENL